MFEEAISSVNFAGLNIPSSLSRVTFSFYVVPKLNMKPLPRYLTQVWIVLKLGWS